MLGGGTGSILDMIIRLCNNRELLRKRRVFKKQETYLKSDKSKQHPLKKLRYKTASKEQIIKYRAKKIYSTAIYVFPEGYEAKYRMLLTYLRLCQFMEDGCDDFIERALYLQKIKPGDINIYQLKLEYYMLMNDTARIIETNMDIKYLREDLTLINE